MNTNFRRGALAFAVLAGLTACSAPISGAATAGTSETSAPRGGTASALLGNFATYDPCSLVDPAAPDEFEVLSTGDRRSFEQCALAVAIDGGGQAMVQVGRLGEVGRNPDGDERIADLDGGLWLVGWAADESTCQRAVAFADDVTLAVSATGRTGSTALCRVAEAVARTVAEAARAGRTRHDRYPANSLALLDPCALVTDETVRTLPEYPRARRQTAPARHSCSWSSGGAAATLRVTFGLGPAPEAHEGDEERDLAGRPAVVSRLTGESGSLSCTVSAGHLPSDVSTRPGVELVEVESYVPAGGGTCDSAVAVATEAVARLPGP
jgi:uncharacterized protein DUF3558